MKPARSHSHLRFSSLPFPRGSFTSCFYETRSCHAPLGRLAPPHLASADAVSVQAETLQREEEPRTICLGLRYVLLCKLRGRRTAELLQGAPTLGPCSG